MTRTEELGKAKSFKRLRRRYFILVAIIACVVLLPGNDVILARDDDKPRLPKSAEQQRGPTDVEWDLDNSFPKRGSLLELILQCPENQHQ